MKLALSWLSVLALAICSLAAPHEVPRIKSVFPSAPTSDHHRETNPFTALGISKGYDIRTAIVRLDDL
jgi:hypothetical protein